MRVAALYDVHGNVHALEAVLAEIDVERIVFGGDLASGPFPRETIELAQSLPNAVFVRGNADELATPAMDEAAEKGRRWVEGQLSQEQLRWLAALPFQATFDDTLYVHANPIDVLEVVTQWTPDQELERYRPHIETSQIVTGHVHMQWRRELDGVSWICAGSVGMPYEQEPGAYWALVEDGQADFHRTDYDVDRAADAVRRSGHPLAHELAEENVRRVPSQDEVRAFFAQL